MSTIERAPDFGVGCGPMSASARQVRSARIFMGWHQAELAARTHLSIGTIKQIEAGTVDPRVSTMEAIERAFYEAGLIFINSGEASSGGGEGFRLRSANNGD